MLEAFLSGTGTGMIMSIMLGTVFFALVQNSIDNGFRSCLMISAGVIFSDIILISLSIVNANLIPEGSTTELVVRIFGAVFLLFYGFNMLRKRKEVKYPETKAGRFFYFFGTGFALNILNPGNYVGWLAVSTHLTTVVQFNLNETLTFYTGALTAIFGMEILIAFSAFSLKRFITEHVLAMIDRVVGILFILFGIALFVQFYF